MIKRIGIMTGGGDCPGLNAAIRAVVRSAYHRKIEVIGFQRGFSGMIHKDFQVLDLDVVSGILPKGGTILGSSRTDPLKGKFPFHIQKNLEDLKIGASVIIGGDGTLRATLELSRQIPLTYVAIPKTIDNDLEGTDVTFGFDTAVSIATEAIDRLHTTAESHRRVMIIEVMGRSTGWIATYAGIAGGADCILIPEIRMDIGCVIELIKKRHRRGKTFSLIVVAEGAAVNFGKRQRRTRSIGEILSTEIERRMGFETRLTRLGYVQRGGTPTAYDRILATRFGTFATDLVCKKNFGKMVCLSANSIKAIPLERAVRKIKRCDLSLYHIAERFFG